MTLSVFTTACPRNCYSTCGMRVEVEHGRIRRIEAHPDNRATPRGVCLKGLSYVERVSSPDRVLRPLLRTPGSEDFVPIGWDEALDRIAERLTTFARESGPRSVFYYAGSGTKGLLNGAGLAFWRLFGGCTTTYGDLCWPAGLEATRLTLGENAHNAPWDLVNAGLIVMWGKNPAETNVHQMAFVDDALDRGARLIVIDPRRTETAERAELCVQPRPGTDGALALGVAHLLIRDGRVDRPFVDAHVLGFEEFAASVREWTPERAASIAGVQPAVVERLADAIADSPPVTICPGFGMQRYTQSGQTMRALLSLLAITGNIGRPGAGWVYANLQTQIFDDVKDPLAFYPPEHDDGPVRVSISTAALGRDMLATRDPRLRMAWVERGNPLTQNPESNAVRRAFAALEFRVVVDQFLTDTARAADLVLPAKTMFEQTDVIGAYWHPYLQLRQKILEPPGEVKPETEVYWQLAQRLGLEPGAVAACLPAPGDAAVEAFLTEKLRRHDGLTLERLRQGPVLAPGQREVAFADRVFATPSGRIELRSDEAVARWDVDPLPSWSAPEESPEPDPERAEPDPERAERHPLHLLTPNTKSRIHSQFGNLQMIRALGERPAVTMHAEDARARGIRDGERVSVFNDRGRLELPARLCGSIRRGCVSITNGWWRRDGAAVNELSLGRETDMGHGAAFHDVLVQVERVDGR